MPHESTVEHEKGFSNGETEEAEEDMLLKHLKRHSRMENQESSVPSLYAIMPSEVTHHHDTDDDEDDYYDEEQQSDKSAEN